MAPKRKGLITKMQTFGKLNKTDWNEALSPWNVQIECAVNYSRDVILGSFCVEIDVFHCVDYESIKNLILKIWSLGPFSLEPFNY
ncbi:hypothetical protein WDU94_002617, partial [Cyamophila willieti]